jgi:hypothetical protein
MWLCDCTNLTCYLDKAILNSTDTPPCATDEMSCQQHTSFFYGIHPPLLWVFTAASYMNVSKCDLEDGYYCELQIGDLG